MTLEVILQTNVETARLVLEQYRGASGEERGLLAVDLADLFGGMGLQAACERGVQGNEMAEIVAFAERASLRGARAA